MSKWICPKCGSRLVEKPGRYGNFIGCTNYKGGCKYTRNVSSYKPQLPKSKSKAYEKKLLKIKKFKKDNPKIKATIWELMKITNRQRELLRKGANKNKKAEKVQRAEIAFNKRKTKFRKKFDKNQKV